jgi:hypothetical protein
VVVAEETMAGRGAPAAGGSDEGQNSATSVMQPRMSKMGRRKEMYAFMVRMGMPTWRILTCGNVEYYQHELIQCCAYLFMSLGHQSQIGDGELIMYKR